MMDINLLLYGAVAALFTYSCFSITARVYQFATFPRTFGAIANISLMDLSRLADETQDELPSFKIVVPAYQEALVIEATLGRLSSLNYPRSHLEIYVVTYEDEPASKTLESTFEVVRRTAAKINTVAGRDLVRHLYVPLDFKGYFPESLDSAERHIGKARGLNFALKTIHEENELDERSYYIGAMNRAGHLAGLDEAIVATARVADDVQSFAVNVAAFFDPTSADYVGPASLSLQLGNILDLIHNATAHESDHECAVQILHAYIEAEAPRFFMQLQFGGDQAMELAIMPGRQFLYEIMRAVETESLPSLALRFQSRDIELARDRPRLHRALAQTRNGEDLFQLTRQINSRWMAVYDADADAPLDLFRHLAARIMTEPSTMGFQGPVAAVANFDAVHPLCKLAGLWMAFCHATSYPRLISRQSWAHPLAGTNWCFRIEGFERDGRTMRTPPYNEAQRRFILSFDPKQLTEDLEAGIRMFSDWRVNADWHPYLEMEQTPPTPRALIAQWTRWTQGTLQTLSYVLHGRLSRTQKVRLALLPLEVMASGAGPVITIALWAVVLFGELTTDPLLVPLTLLLTFANLFYVLPFLAAFYRFRAIALRAKAVDMLRADGPTLVNELENRRHNEALGQEKVRLLRQIAEQLEAGIAPGGFISAYLATRCLEDENRDCRTADHHATCFADLEDMTPNILRRGDLENLVAAFQHLAHQELSAILADGPELNDLTSRLSALHDALTAGAGDRAARRRDYLNLFVWAIPFLLFQLIPYYRGFVRWAAGSRGTHWDKTPRTRKDAI